MRINLPKSVLIFQVFHSILLAPAPLEVVDGLEDVSEGQVHHCVSTEHKYFIKSQISANNYQRIKSNCSVKSSPAMSCC